jgi:hypothetical protein
MRLSATWPDQATKQIYVGAVPLDMCDHAGGFDSVLVGYSYKVGCGSLSVVCSPFRVEASSPTCSPSQGCPIPLSVLCSRVECLP